MKKFLLIVLLLSQSVFFTNAARADLANPIEIINGGIMSFSTNSTENWYVFTLTAESTVWLIGSDNSCGPIYFIYIYDDNMVIQETIHDYASTTLDLSAGKYFINIAEFKSGSFSIYSEDMSNPVATNPVLGSIVNPYLMENGVSSSFGSEIASNVYYFETNTSGNVNVSGSDNSGGPIYFIYIYDDNMVIQETIHDYASTTLDLSAGKYYLVVFENSGNICVYSPVLNPDPEPPVPPYLAGYNDGKQSCIDDPSSCGISSGFYVIPVPKR